MATTAASLNPRFAIPGVLSFDEDRGLTRLQVTSPAARATLYLQGAHLSDWQPSGHSAVLFLSRQSDFAPRKPLRGGVPIVFPWFATDSKSDRVDGRPGPSHGFARQQDWTVEAVKRTVGGLDLKLTLGPTDLSRSMGFDHFLLTLEVSIGSTLEMRLTVENRGAAPLVFEEAFHTYFHVADVHEASVTGLEGTGYLDKVEHGVAKPATGVPVTFTGPVDRVYLDTEAPCILHDGAGQREIHVRKTNSRTTVVWNPYKALPDLGEWDWQGMLAVETANVGKDARSLGPGEHFTMGTHVSVNKLPPGGAKPSERNPHDTA